MTRHADSQKYANYVTKAENPLQPAGAASERRAYDGAVMNRMHGAINALDALTTFHPSAPQDHTLTCCRS